MAYVPPSLRDRSVPSATATRFYTHDEVHAFTGSRSNTLIPDQTTPTNLSAVVLYKDQHPDWPSAREIFCKSNLEVLRSPAVTEGIESFPVFIELPFAKKFEFGGYFRVRRVRWLAPQSQELKVYLARKFDPPTSPGTGRRRSVPVERTEVAWQDAWNREWAVVALEKDATRLGMPF